MIAIIDYGLGNVKAFANVYKRLNLPAVIANDAQTLEDATKIVLPGVGAFDYAMSRLNNSGMRETLEQRVLGHHIPVLGICVGMQMLAQSSEEGTLQGLGWIDGQAKKFQHDQTQASPLPHMGWNTVQSKSSKSLFKNIDQASRFYFLHSYYFDCHNAENILATAHYECEFACSVNKGNIYGVQCHPEKSHHAGIQLLKNFGAL